MAIRKRLPPLQEVAPVIPEPCRDHFAVLKRTTWRPCGASGWKPVSWADVVLDMPDSFDPPLPDSRQNRAQLRAYCRDPYVPPFHAFIAVMAWGEMMPKSGSFQDTVREQRHRIENLVQETRKGLPRAAAFDLWMDKRTKVKGVGPSFFTKILAFTSPCKTMAIMDQWTGKAVNLLYGGEIVRLSKPTKDELEQNVKRAAKGKDPKFSVSPDSKTCGQDYERYCLHLEHLQERLREETISATEERIFSKQSKKEEMPTWRDYVIKTWRPPEDDRPSPS